MKLFLAAIVCWFFVGCNSEGSFKSNRSNLAIDSINFDSVILLKAIEKSNYKGVSLTKVLAKQILYNHFIKQGCFTADNQPQLADLTDEDSRKMTVEFNDLFYVNLNNNLYNDGIITYWLENPYVNGHCVQPKRAIISDTDDGYKITNEEFIPDSYLIDSVISKNAQVVVFGREYDCGNHKILRQLKINLRVLN